MAEIGIMVYGFSSEDAEKIKTSFEGILKEDVIMITGSKREEDVVGDIIEDESYREFQEKKDPKVIMFLGFDGPMIHATMDNFPKLEGPRPIFCTPTERNIGWKLKDLLIDLLEERENFRKMKMERQKQNE